MVIFAINHARNDTAGPHKERSRFYVSFRPGRFDSKEDVSVQFRRAKENFLKLFLNFPPCPACRARRRLGPRYCESIDRPKTRWLVVVVVVVIYCQHFNFEKVWRINCS